MNFRKSVINDAETRYRDMIEGTIAAPFSYIAIDDYIKYKTKRATYLQRLDKEKEQFNSALEKIGVICKEHSTKREKRNAVILQVLFTFLFLLPSLFLVFYTVAYKYNLVSQHIKITWFVISFLGIFSLIITVNVVLLSKRRSYDEDCRFSGFMEYVFHRIILSFICVILSLVFFIMSIPWKNISFNFDFKTDKNINWGDIFNSGSETPPSESAEDQCIEIFTIEELYSMEDNKSYKLMCDLDLAGNAWIPLDVKGFDGNGFTISNCNIYEATQAYTENGGAQDYYYVGFFSTATWIENITFENINVQCVLANKELKSAGIAVAAYSASDYEDKDAYLKNVIVKDSSLNIQVTYSKNGSYTINIGGICGDIPNVTDCVIQDSNVTYRKNGYADVRLGIAFGETRNSEITIKNCHADNVQLSCVNQTGTVDCGGMIGRYSGAELIGCSVKNCGLNISTYRTLSVGGVLGQAISGSANISGNISERNSITVKMLSNEYGADVGGFAGNTYSSIANCMSNANAIEVDAPVSNQYYDYNCGGFIGAIKQIGSYVGSVANCISTENNITGAEGSKASNGGFIGDTVGVVMNCAVKDVTIAGNGCDEFSKSTNKIMNCFVDSTDYNNSNNLSVLSDEDWNSFDILKQKLQLSETYWVWQTDGGLTIRLSN